MSPICCVHYFVVSMHTIPLPITITFTIPYHTIQTYSLLIDPCSLVVINQTLLLVCYFWFGRLSFSSFSFFPIILFFFPGPFPLFGTLLTTALLPLNLQGFFFLYKSTKGGGKVSIHTHPPIHPHHLTYTYTHVLFLSGGLFSSLQPYMRGIPKEKEREKKGVATIRTMEAKKMQKQRQRQRQKARAILSTLTFILWTTSMPLLLHTPCFLSSPIPPLLCSCFFSSFLFFSSFPSCSQLSKANKKKSVRAQVKRNKHLLTLGQGFVWACMGLCGLVGIELHLFPTVPSRTRCCRPCVSVSVSL